MSLKPDMRAAGTPCAICGKRGTVIPAVRAKVLVYAHPRCIRREAKLVDEYAVAW
jgi:hypothetical protein